jgi:hypothetical protein
MAQDEACCTVREQHVAPLGLTTACTRRPATPLPNGRGVCPTERRAEGWKRGEPGRFP